MFAKIILILTFIETWFLKAWKPIDDLFTPKGKPKRKPQARAKNAQESISIAVGSCIATLVANLTGESLSFAGDTFYNEEDLISDATEAAERAKRFMSAAGTRDVTMQNLARNGTRELKLIMGTDYEKLVSWGQSRVQKMFDLDFYYVYNTGSTAGGRIQRHKRCFLVGLPIPGVGRDRGYVTIKFDYGDLALIDPATDKEI